jgi:hypothetical protein
MSDVTLTIDQLIYPLSPAQVKAKIYEVLARLNCSTTNWKPGGVVRLMIAACSIVLAALSVLISLIARSAFLTLSSGDWLTLVARYVYGVERQLATLATGTVTLVNNEGGRFDYAAEEAVFLNITTGKTYRNTEPFVLEPGGAVTVAVRAEETGSASSTGPGTITGFVTTMLGVTVSNDVTLVGLDEQSDDSLIAECLLKPQSLSPNGARGAFEYFAKKATRSGGTAVGINRVKSNNSSTTGQTVLTVATPTGEVSGDPSNPATDLGAVFASVAGNCLPGCVTLTVRSARARTLNVEFTAYFKDLAMLPSEQERQAAPAVEQWFADLDIGGTTIPGVIENIVPRDTLRDIIAASFAKRPTLVVIHSPASNVPLDPLDVAGLGTITARAA